ncbi:MAG TPA: serine/threonine-protein kinase [Candidatus Hydrogenedentes bacterium]|nr:serine/threonine-protein kinase [Candidatus Hydrogenedentota bacterium]
MSMKQPELPDRLKLYHFKCDRVLGRGGTGTVYRAIDTVKGEVVAVKLFHANFFRNNSQVRDFAKSVQSFLKFNHQNVVRVLEFIEGPEGLCLTMEYVDGPDMKWYIENRTWNLEERLVIVAQICNGLQYIHDQGFTHHDLKPGNILFTRKGVAKLSDYSLCRARNIPFFDSGLAEQITPMYVAPEIIMGQKATSRSDIYSLGIALYLMFTGKLPFEVDNLQRLYQAHLRAVPLHPHMVNRRCPQSLGDVIMKMIEKDPAKRYESCDQLRIVLADVGKSRI